MHYVLNFKHEDATVNRQLNLKTMIKAAVKWIQFEAGRESAKVC
jgi:hypothetical protein